MLSTLSICLNGTTYVASILLYNLHLIGSNCSELSGICVWDDQCFCSKLLVSPVIPRISWCRNRRRIFSVSTVFLYFSYLLVCNVQCYGIYYVAV